MTIDGPDHVVQTEKVPHSKLTQKLVKFSGDLIDVIFKDLWLILLESIFITALLEPSTLRA
jgi:hypothetical protein